MFGLEHDSAHFFDSRTVVLSLAQLRKVLDRWRGVVWCGVVRGVVVWRCGVVRGGVVWRCGVVWRGEVWCLPPIAETGTPHSV